MDCISCCKSVGTCELTEIVDGIVHSAECCVDAYVLSFCNLLEG